MPNLNKNDSVTRSPIKMNLRGEEIHVYPPRDAEEAQSRGLFVSNSNVTYLHLNGSVASAALGEKGTTGLIVCYGELADKLGEHVIQQVQGQKGKARKLTIKADANVEITPVMDADDRITGNRVEIKVYGYQVGNMYYTTKGKQLVVSERSQYVPEEQPATKQAKISFF